MLKFFSVMNLVRPYHYPSFALNETSFVVRLTVVETRALVLWASVVSSRLALDCAFPMYCLCLKLAVGVCLPTVLSEQQQRKEQGARRH